MSSRITICLNPGTIAVGPKYLKYGTWVRLLDIRAERSVIRQVVSMVHCHFRVVEKYGETNYYLGFQAQTIQKLPPLADARPPIVTHAVALLTSAPSSLPRVAQLRMVYFPWSDSMTLHSSTVCWGGHYSPYTCVRRRYKSGILCETSDGKDVRTKWDLEGVTWLLARTLSLPFSTCATATQIRWLETGVDYQQHRKEVVHSRSRHPASLRLRQPIG